MPAPKVSEKEVSSTLKRYGLWADKIADIPIPKWTGGGYKGVAYVKQKPFDFYVIGPGGAGAMEVKFSETSFNFIRLKGWTPSQENMDLFLMGYSTGGTWPSELESYEHGIRPHQRRGLTAMNDLTHNAWLALMMGTHISSKETPRKMWFVPWVWWINHVEIPIIEAGFTSLPYSPDTTNRKALKCLTAVHLLKEWELIWDPTIQEQTKWTIPQQNLFHNTFGLNPLSPNPLTVGYRLRQSNLVEPTVLPTTSEI